MTFPIWLLAAIVLTNAIILARMDKVPESKIDALINVVLMLSALYGFLRLLPEYLGAL